MERREIDVIQGEQVENRIKDDIEKILLSKLTKTPPLSVMDFTDDDGDYYEIKSRNNNYNTYPTTMVGENKIKFCKKYPHKNHFFFFCFQDGDYYYHYNPEDVLSFGRGGRYDRGRPEMRQYCYIPINLLHKFPNEFLILKKGLNIIK